jgi:polar amino acid transport system permease protein
MPPTSTTGEKTVAVTSTKTSFDFREGFPYWLVVMLGIIGFMVFQIIVNDQYREAYTEILPGLRLTLIVTAGSFFASMFLGLFIGVARVSSNRFLETISRVYIEFVRGMPMLVWLFLIALVLAPDAVDLINKILGTDVKTRSVSFAWRGAIALCLFYAAFLAEVFRAGIQSVDSGQKEAGRSLGLTDRQVLRKITLPQAFRNTLPAFGNDLIALMKDTSLISVIAGAELTYNARIYSGSSFRFREAFFVLAVFYVTLTLVLSLLLQVWERRLAIPGRTD